MARCPLYRYKKCNYADSLPDREVYNFVHYMCRGKGTQLNGWKNCTKYYEIDPIDIAKKEHRNMKIGIAIGIVIGLLSLIEYKSVNQPELIGATGTIGRIGVIRVIMGVLTYFGICAFYGIGLASISVTVYAIQDLFDDMGCSIPSIILYLFVLSCLVVFGVTSIVGIVRYFKRRRLFKQT